MTAPRQRPAAHGAALARVLACLAALLGSPASARAQTGFDFDRFTVLDERVQGADAALSSTEPGSRPWTDAVLYAISARGEMFEYLNATIDDPSLDAETLDALLRNRATMAIDATHLYAQLSRCRDARAWYDRAAETQHPSMQAAMAAASAAAATCQEVDEPAASGEAPAPAEDLAEAAGGADEPAEGRGARRGLSLALISAGAGLGAAAIGFDVAGIGDRKTISELACGDAASQCDLGEVDRYSAADSREDRRLIAIAVLGGAGLVAGGTGIVLGLTGRHGAESPDVDAALSWSGTRIVAGLRW